MEETGIDPIFYVVHPTDNTTMVSVIKEFSNLCTEHVTTSVRYTQVNWDQYDMDNEKVARKLIYTILGTSLFRDVQARDPNGEIPAAVLWM
jgi:hypothetical protein